MTASSAATVGGTPCAARAARRHPSRVAKATAMWIERSRPINGSVSHWPIVLSGGPADARSGARNAVNERPGRRAPHQTRLTAAAGTSASTTSRSPTGRPPIQDSHSRSAMQAGTDRHCQATRSSATPAPASTYSAVRLNPSTRHRARTSAPPTASPGRIHTATLSSMKGIRNSSDRVRSAVPDGRSFHRYASSVTPPAPCSSACPGRGR
ncbi:hypothetical protein AB0F95_17865 [Micromonospora tulbaghiae]|uniref:hypothetical protein n=1 Tax=Micromonospora tulbaghiae TaxID=479978 RepID=UPI0033EBE04F